MKAGTPLFTAEDEIRRISGFYPTPLAVIDMMIAEAGPFRPGDRVLEPSAGRGDIADRLRLAGAEPDVIEPHPQLAAVLRSKGYPVFEGKFEDFHTGAAYSKIVMNPPFADTLDFAHIRHAFSLLEPGGALVSLLTDGDDDASPRERADFADWAFSVGHILRLRKVPLDLFQGDGVFRPSVIPKRMITLIKPPGLDSTPNSGPDPVANDGRMGPVSSR